MDAVKFIEERGRMCKSTNGDCNLCPLNNWCGRGIKRQSDFAVNIVSAVEEWSAAHSRKTQQDVFLEQYPEAELTKDGVISICPMAVSAAYRNKTGGCASPTRPRCADCIRDFWTQEVE